MVASVTNVVVSSVLSLSVPLTDTFITPPTGFVTSKLSQSPFTVISVVIAVPFCSAAAARQWSG